MGRWDGVGWRWTCTTLRCSVFIDFYQSLDSCKAKPARKSCCAVLFFASLNVKIPSNPRVQTILKRNIQTWNVRNATSLQTCQCTEVYLHIKSLAMQLVSKESTPSKIFNLQMRRREIKCWQVECWINQSEPLRGHCSCWIAAIRETSLRFRLNIKERGRHRFRPINPRSGSSHHHLLLVAFNISARFSLMSSTLAPPTAPPRRADKTSVVANGRAAFLPATPVRHGSSKNTRLSISADARTQTQPLSSTERVERRRSPARSLWFSFEMKRQKYGLITFHCRTTGKSRTTFRGDHALPSN